jgi:hypothetical protein
MAGFAFAWTAPTAHRNPRRLQIPTRGFATDTRGLFDAPKRPPEAPECDDLLLFALVQNVSHATEEHEAPRRGQRLDRGAS